MRTSALRGARTAALTVALMSARALSAMTPTHAEPPVPPPARVFWSGHSLTDLPIPEYVARIAAAAGHAHAWNRQFGDGASIRARTRGDRGGWSGYRVGVDRDGRPVDVLAELRAPKAVDGPYDALVITEQHNLLETLVWNDPVRHLRHYHERFIAANPAGTTWFYEPWLDIDDKSDPQRWIAHERAASPMWQCFATRVNVSLEAEGRPDRIRSLPAGAALAELVDRATRGPGVAGVSRDSVRATVEGLVHDRVHLTPVGAYYVAVATYALMFQRSPVDVWAPEGMDPAQARALQQVAWEFAQRYRATHRPLTLAQCRQQMQGPFARGFWRYMHATYWAGHGASPREWLYRARLVATLHWRLWRDTPDNPLRYDPRTDGDYWFPAP